MSLAHVEAVVLAAGYSSRMKGKNKLMLEISGRPVIEHVIKNVLNSNIKTVAVIVGNHKEKLMPILQKYPIKIVENTNFSEGISSSIKQAAASLPHFTSAVMVFLGDMPLIRPQTINEILCQYLKNSCLIAAPVYRGKRGHPVLFDKVLFPEMLKLSGDVGAGSILKAHYQDVCRVNVDDPGILLDVDRPEDFLAVGGKFSS